MTDLYWDPLTPELRDDPYPLWRRLRDEAPVYRNDRFDFYALSRFVDIEAAHKDFATFSSNLARRSRRCHPSRSIRG